jgi:uncharacterized protein (DUF2252 family)
MATKKTASARKPKITPVTHLKAEESARLGREARKATPRSSHEEFSPASDRPDPVALLERQAETRVPELVPIRYGRMLVTPFTFYRGAALVMASDLATTPRSGFFAQICGDAHLSNFGLFASPERSLMFDVNDFDETLPGPWEWDVKRLAASVVIAARDQEFTEAEARTAALEVGAGYRREMSRLAGLSTLDVWYSHIDINDVTVQIQEAARSSRSKNEKKMASKTMKIVEKARTRDSMQALDKLTEIVDGQRQIRNDPPLVVRAQDLFPELESDALLEWLHTLLQEYRLSLQSDRRHLIEEFKLLEIARKVVGVGSVGTRAWIMLLTGPNDDPLFLQAKEAEASVLEEFVGASLYEDHGQRVVAGQHLMQAASDIFLGWQQTVGLDGKQRSYYVRQLRDWKGSFEIEGAIPEGLARYAGVCAVALARAHARSGDRIAIASYLGSSNTFDEAICRFSEAYADQNQRDYDLLKQAEASGRIAVETGL